MPFTISHAAIVLPFSRLLARWRLLSAVVIGAMVPDFGLFLPWRIQRFETHSAEALLTFCLPVGLTTYWIFQFLIKTPVLEILPEGAYARWYAFSSPAGAGSLRQWLLAASGVLAGAVSHLIWDGFTHGGARGVRMIPWLEDPIDVGHHHLIGFRLLQDGSSVVGLVVVVGLVCYGLRHGREPPVPGRPLRQIERRAWVLTYVLAVLGLSVACLWGARVSEPWGHSVRGLANAAAVALLRGSALALLLTSAALTLRLRALHKRSARRSLEST
jgi:Domain of unknown function (DUF4184)